MDQFEGTTNITTFLKGQFMPIGGMSGFEGLYFRVIIKIYRKSRPTFFRDDITMLDAK